MLNALKEVFASSRLGAAQGHLNRHRYEKALKNARAALALTPSDDIRWLGVAIAGKRCYHLGMKEEAREYLLEAERLLVPSFRDEQGSEFLTTELVTVKWYLDRL